MSSVRKRPRKLERYRKKLVAKAIPEAQGKGRTEAQKAKAVNIRAALAHKKVSGKLSRELDKLGLEELGQKLEESRKELFTLRFKHATAQLVNVAAMSAAKRRIARILTLIKQKEMGA